MNLTSPYTILGIESSCDDTSAALLQKDANGTITILSEITASQIDIHKKYGGIVPEIAGRKHAEKIIPVISTVMDGHPTPDAIAVTTGPGLMTGLLVGTETAKTLAYCLDIPIIPINHIEGHIYSVLLEKNVETSFSVPALACIVSGGHTEIIFIKEHGTYEKIGGTRDDAVGEVYDKVAKMLGFPYPGGPKIAALAADGDGTAINFPRPMIAHETLDMSFAGLKTAALYWLRDNTLESMPDFCASFEQAIVDVLVKKIETAIALYEPVSLLLAGGVSANSHIRTALEQLAQKSNIIYYQPPKKYSMDNATMIARAGLMHAEKNNISHWKNVTANPVWKIYESNSNTSTQE